MEKMCPDHQILSVFADGELPSPWKEKLVFHLESCPRCRERVESYQTLSMCLETPSPERARERVWNTLNSRIARSKERGFYRVKGFWRQRISIPLPAAAAAAAGLIALITLLAARQPAAQPVPVMAAAGSIEGSLNETIPVANMGEVLQYLGSHDNADFVILKLPESRNFRSAGEPTILKAADYRRNAP
jgi:anti-sigma factor RsiW